MVNEMMSRERRIHCLWRFVDVDVCIDFCLRMDFGAGIEDVLEVVSVLGLGLLKFSFTALLGSATVVVVVGGGGK